MDASGSLIKDLEKRLSLDPIDRGPIGHLMKFTQRSFPLKRRRRWRQGEQVQS